MKEPHPRESAQRCAFRAEVRADPMLGTAFPAARLLLVEQPGPWGRAGLPESHFDRRVAADLERRVGAAGIRVEAIRRPGRTPDGARRRWALVDARPGQESLRWDSFADETELLELLLDGSAGRPDAEPIYLVCTHGKRDPCCALRGRPVAQALAAQRPGRVWECSHLGGDRFAANVLVLPSGLLYGRVRVEDVGSLAGAADVGEVLGAQLRGRIGLAPVAQAALVFGYAHLDVRARDAVRVRSTSASTGGAARVTLDGPDGALEVVVRAEQVSASGLTCGNPRPNRFLAYRPSAQ